MICKTAWKILVQDKPTYYSLYKNGNVVLVAQRYCLTTGRPEQEKVRGNVKIMIS